MSQYYSFQQCFGAINWVLATHGLVGYTFANWNLNLLMVTSFIVSCVYWIIGGSQIVGFLFVIYNQVSDSFFAIFFNMVDEFRWCAIILNAHIVNFKRKKCHRMLRQLIAVSEARIPKRTKVWFNTALVVLFGYAYPILLFLRINYAVGYELDSFVFLTYSYEVAVLFCEQTLLFVLIYQVHLNLTQVIWSNGDNLRTNLEFFEKNLKVFCQIMKIFGNVFVLYLFNVPLAVTHFLFIGLAEAHLRDAVLEHIVWDIAFLIIICCVSLVHQVVVKVKSKIK